MATIVIKKKPSKKETDAERAAAQSDALSKGYRSLGVGGSYNNVSASTDRTAEDAAAKLENDDDEDDL